MLRVMFTDPSPWIWLDGSLLRLGLNGGEYVILALSTAVLFLVSLAQERGVRIREWIGLQPLWLRWAIPMLAVWAIWIFGTYSSGFNTTDFIYGGF